MRNWEQIWQWLNDAPDITLDLIEEKIRWALRARPEHPDDLPEGMSFDEFVERQREAHEWLVVTLKLPCTEADLEGVRCTIQNIQMDRMTEPSDMQKMLRERYKDWDDDIPF